MTNPITTLSRERLEQLASTVQHLEVQEMARALLALMDAKPVAFTFSDEFSDLNASGIGVCRVWSEECYPDAPVKLYTTPPAPSAPDGWIKCSDRMPDNVAGSVKYVVYETLNESVNNDYWDAPDQWGGQFEPFWNHYGEYVTHWMPLPATPGGE